MNDPVEEFIRAKLAEGKANHWVYPGGCHSQVVVDIAIAFQRQLDKVLREIGYPAIVQWFMTDPLKEFIRQQLAEGKVPVDIAIEFQLRLDKVLREIGYPTVAQAFMIDIDNLTEEN